MRLSSPGKCSSKKAVSTTPGLDQKTYWELDSKVHFPFAYDVDSHGDIRSEDVGEGEERELWDRGEEIDSEQLPLTNRSHLH